MIVATVGHVDHGKTALVQALTGVDTDRLPEEKARGMTIDLGFAYRETGSGQKVGFVDVPGHERFVHTMVAGVSGIHHALIVVAADDGPMPQTTEHIAILDLLGVASATVVVTKIDRVDAPRLAQVRGEIERRLAGTGLADAAQFPVCAPRGEGVAELWAHLERLAPAYAPKPPRGYFRFAVDRSFSLPGAGLIVTGTVSAGMIAAGAPVAVCPGGTRARVRGLRSQNRELDVASAGERCAINLSGGDLHPEAIHRGDWIVDERLLAPTARIDVRLRLLPGADPLRQGARVHLHLGAKQATGRALPLETPSVEPGTSALLQLVLDEPIGALWGDRLIVRDWSARSTVGGGIVLDPFPATRRCTRAERVASLRIMEGAEAGSVLRALLAAQPGGVDLARFALSRNLTPADRDPLFAGAAMATVDAGDEQLGFDPGHWSALRACIVEALEEAHGRHPDSWGPDEAALRRQSNRDVTPQVFALRVRALIAEGELARRGNRLHLPRHRPELTPGDLELWQRIEPLLSAAGARPPSAGNIAAELGMPVQVVKTFLQHAAQLGFVMQIADNRYYPPQAIAALAAVARDLALEHDDGLFSAAEFRDRSGVGRNVTIVVLEYFDHCGLTRRAGEKRSLARRPEQVFGEAAR